MADIDKDWEDFKCFDDTGLDNNNTIYENNNNLNNIDDTFDSKFIPKCSDIYISTQTKIAYLNQPIDLNSIYWKLPIIKYQEHKEGIIKSQMKVNSINKEQVVALEKNISECPHLLSVDVIHNVDNPNARKVQFKDVRKINIGICKKDLVSYRTKKKGAFYNCFVLILRLKDDNDAFKEFHVKVFNTGKLELPGIKNDRDLFKVLDKIVNILSPFIEKKLTYNDKDIKTVLINSNFTCNYYIDREKLSKLIKYHYNLHVVYDPCSYPGIQCKFYYNDDYSKNIGTCQCKEKCYNKKNKTKGCSEISFMIFRTGSILIVGKCTEEILHNIYDFIKTILLKEYSKFIIHEEKTVKKEKKKKIWKKNIHITLGKTN